MRICVFQLPRGELERHYDVCLDHHLRCVSHYVFMHARRSVRPPYESYMSGGPRDDSACYSGTMSGSVYCSSFPTDTRSVLTNSQHMISPTVSVISYGGGGSLSEQGLVQAPPSIQPNSRPFKSAPGAISPLTSETKVPDEAQTRSEKALSSHVRKIEELEKVVQNLNRKIREQEKDLSRMSSRIQELEMRQGANGVFIWKIDHFNDKLRSAERSEGGVIHSPGFYTRTYGYKMCIRINLNGVGESGHGRYMSLFIHLMQGEFDDLLEWPFEGNITLSILDQRNPKETPLNHLTETLNAQPHLEAFQRAKTKRNTKGFGYIEFAQISTIRNRPYLKNNTLYIRATVMDRSSPV